MFETGSTVATPPTPAAYAGIVKNGGAAVCRSLLRQAQDFHAADLKPFGLLLGDPQAPRHPGQAVDYARPAP